MTSHQLNISPLPGAQSLKMLAYDALRAALAELPLYDSRSEIRFDERDLSRRFGVSRTPLRHALSQLEREGLIKVVPRRGVYVVRKTRQEMRDIACVWCALEKLSARSLCATPSAGDLDYLAGRLRVLEKTGQECDVAAFSDAELAFNKTLLDASRIAYVTALADRLGFHMRVVFGRINEIRNARSQRVDEARALLKALNKRDDSEAEAVLDARCSRLCADVDAYMPLH